MPIVEDRFGLGDEEYWTDPWRTRKALQRPLMQKGEEGLVLGTPRLVALNRQQSFPAALIRVARSATLIKIPSRSALILTAVDMDTWELHAQLALADAGRMPAAAAGGTAAGRDSFSGDDSAMTSEGHTVDLASRLQLQPSRREYLVTAVLLDRPSNRSRMKLVESAGYEDPAVDQFLREHLARRMKMPAVYPREALPLPNYRRQEHSPAIPAEAGIALSIPRVSVYGAGMSCIVNASYRLPVRGQHVLRANDAAKPPPAAETARIPITLLLTGSADPRPQILRLVVPCYEPLEESAGQSIALGHFSFDLCRMPEVRIAPQTYFLYAFAGEVMTAAVPAAFVRLPLEELDAADSL